MQVKKHLELMGHRVEDRVTGFSGVVSSVCFDLYGCIQAAVNPGMDKDGKMMDSLWFDVSRLSVKTTSPVMEVPNFDVGIVAEGKHGPAEKPAYKSA